MLYEGVHCKDYRINYFLNSMTKTWHIILLVLVVAYLGFIGNYVFVHKSNQKQLVSDLAASSTEEVTSIQEISTASGTEATTIQVAIVATSTKGQSISTGSSLPVVQCGNEIVNCVSKNIKNWELCPSDPTSLEYYSSAELSRVGMREYSSLRIKGIVEGKCVLEETTRGREFFIPAETKKELQVNNISEAEFLKGLEANAKEGDPEASRFPKKQTCKFVVSSFKKEFIKAYSVINFYSLDEVYKKNSSFEGDPDTPECSIPK
jgi:hypothetical protein